MVKQTTTFTVNIKGNIDDIMSKVNTVKNGVSNIFSASNLGQSMLGDFNALERILKRIQNTASSPIRSNWGAENLIAEFRKAGLSIDDLQKKLDTLSIADRKEKFKIFDQDTLNKIKTANDYLAKGKKELADLKAIQDQIKKTEEEINKITGSEREKLRKQSKRADEKRDIAESELKATKKVEQAEYEARRKSILSSGLLTRGKIASDLGLGADFYGSGTPKVKISDAERDALLAKVDSTNLTFNKNALKPEELEALKKQLTDLIQLKNEFVEYQSKKDAFDTAKENAEKAKTAYEGIKGTLKDLRDSLPALQNNLQKALSTPEFEKFKQIAKEVGIDLNDLSQIKSFEDLQSKIEEVNAAYEKLANGGIEEEKKALSQLTDIVLKNKQATEGDIEAQKLQNEQMANVNALTNRIKMFTGFYGILNLVRRSISSAISTIKDLDEQMTKMAVVTSPTISDYWKQLPQYTKRANALGTAIKEVYEADTLYYQQGLKTNQVIAVSNETMKMARIAALDAAEATDRMTSAMRGFNMEINETSAQRVNDVYSQLAAITASDVNEISVAMTKTASIAHSAGMEFETTAAFLSQIIETTRESADTAGTALKTIIARFEELKKNPSEIGEIDGEIVDANKIETALRSVGIALRDTQGQFRDLDDVFLELAQKWDSLDKNTQRYIATIAAGSRQQSRFIAMMQNYAHTTELVAKANGSAGASQKQFEKTLDSMKTKLNALKNAWDTFTMGILKSDVLKLAVTIGTTFMDLLNKVGKAADTMNVSLLGSVTRVGLLVAGLRTLGVVGRKVIPYLAGKGSIGGIIGGGLVNKSSSDYGKKIGLIQGLANRGAVRRDLLANGMADTAANREAGFLTKNAPKSLSNIGSGLKSVATKLGPILLIVGAIATTVGVIYTLWKGFKFNSQEEVFKRDKEALDNYKNSVDELKIKLDQINSSVDKYKNLKKELKDLTIGTDEWKEKLSETNKEVLELLQTYPELVKYTTKNMFGEIEIKTEGFEALVKKQEKAVYNAQKDMLRQQVKVNKNTQVENRQNVINTFGLRDSEYYDLNKLNKEELIDYLGSDSKIQQLSDSLGLNTSETSSLINTLIENKDTLEENNASIEALSQSIETLNPGSSVGVTSQLPYKINQSRVRELKEGLDRGTTYYDNATYQELMNRYAQKYNLGDWRAMLKAQGADGSQNSKQLAVLYGLTQGITDFEQSINKFEKMADRGFLGISSAERGRLEQEVAKSVAELEAQEGAENVYALESDQNKAILEKVFSGALENLTKSEVEALQANNFALFQELNKNYGLGNEAEFDRLVNYISTATDADVFGAKQQQEMLKKLAEENNGNLQFAMENWTKEQREEIEGWSKETEEIFEKTLKEIEDRIAVTGESFGTVLHDILTRESKEVYTKDFSEGPTTLDTLRSELSKKLNAVLNETISQVDISNTNRAKLADTIRQMYFSQGETGVKAYTDYVLEALKNVKPEDTEDFFKMLFDNFDPSNLDWIKSLNAALKLKFGNLDWIDSFTNQMKDLGDAVKKVDLKTLTEQFGEFAKALKQINLGEFTNDFTQEQYERMLAQGFPVDEFIKDLTTGTYSLKGGQDAYVKWSEEYFRPYANDAYKAIAESFEENDYFNGLGSSKDFERRAEYIGEGAVPTAIRDTYGSMALQMVTDNLEDLRSFITENAGLLNQIGVNTSNLKEADITTLLQLLDELIKARDQYKVVAENPDYLNRAIALEQRNTTGHLSSTQHLFDASDNLNTNAAWALYNNIKNDENLDKSKVERYRDLIEVMAKGGIEAERVRKEFTELASELGAHSALSKSYSTITKSMSNITQKLSILDDGMVESLSDVRAVEESLKGLSITLPHIYDEIGSGNMEITQGYADLLNAFSQGNMEAYQGLIDLIAMSSEGGLSALDELRTLDLAQWSEYALELAQILEAAGMGTIMDNKFMEWTQLDLDKMAEEAGGKDKKKDINPWENPYDWLWNITQQINKTLYQRERLERKYKLAVDDTVKSAEDLYDISKKELDNLQEQARLQSLKGQKATEEAQLLLSHYKEYAKYVSMNPLTGQVQVAYEDLDKKGWSQEQGSAFEAFVSKLVELGDEIKDSNKNLEDIEDEVKEIQLRGREEMINLQNRVKEALVTERQREIDTIQDVNDAISAQQSELLEAMQEEINETRRIRENTDRQEEIEKKRQRLSYLQRDTSGANQTEILSLQEEIEKDTLSYGDALIDQSLQQMQKDNEEAAEKRQEQIDIMNTQLARWQESGEIWKSVDDMLTKFFAGDGGSLQNYLQNMENWQALSKLQQEDFDKEFINNGKLAKSFDDGKIASAATDTLTEVKKYSDNLQETLNGSGVLGNAILDLGEYLKVTLKDFNPKENSNDVSSKLGGIGDILKSILNAIKGLKLEESAGELTRAAQDVRGSTTTDKITEEILKNKYDHSVAAFVGAATQSDHLSPSTAIKKVSESIKANEDLFNILKQIFNTTSADIIANSLLTRVGYEGFATGGLSTKTGPAWLDGTPSKPEYVLNAEQTKGFFSLVNGVAAINNGESKGLGGDNYFNVEINVDELSSDYDVEQVANKVKQIIVEDANYRNVNFVQALI